MSVINVRNDLPFMREHQHFMMTEHAKDIVLDNIITAPSHYCIGYKDSKADGWCIVTSGN